MTLASLAAAKPASAREDGAIAAEPTIPAQLSLDDALRIFRTSGLDLLIAEANVRGAEGDARAARAINNPDLSLGVGRALTNCDGCSAPAVSATLSDQGAISQALTGKHGLRVDVADAALQAARLNRKDASRVLEAGLKQQFLAVVIAEAEFELARETQKSAEKTLEVVKRRVNAGAAADTDLLKAQTDSLALEDQVDASELAVRKAKLDLAFLLGVRSQVPDFKVDDSLVKHARDARPDVGDEPRLLQEAIKHRSDLLSAEYSEKRAKAAADLARRTRWPDISLWASYAMQGSGPNAPTPPTLTIGIESLLPIFYQNQGEIQRADADLFTQRLQREKVKAQVVNDVESALHALQIAQRRVQRMGGTLIETADRSRGLTTMQYERGAASLLELLDAQRTFLTINSSYLQSIADYWNAVFTVEQATGRTLH